MTGRAIKLRWLQYFAVLADELHFGRAAAALHVSSPALSRQIRDLEDALGAPLFIRSTRHVHLTDAGRRLYASVCPALDLIDGAIADLRAGPPDTISVAFVSALAGSVIPRAARALRGAHPSSRLHLEQLASREQYERLAAGTLDVGLLWKLDHTEPPSPLVSDELACCPLYVALPPDHEMATWDRVYLADLASEDWLMAADGSDTVVRADFIALCREHGFVPRIRNEATWINSLLALVATGAGVCGAPPPSLYQPSADVALRPLVGCSAYLVAVRREGPPPLLTQSLLESAAVAAAECGMARTKRGSTGLVGRAPSAT